ncbi:MAG: DUF59 domain-containing protein [Verrucomicrobiae bacterium]|nr:DUF59 domain-containing protein [Verrucomicrobiae bacterium]
MSAPSVEEVFQKLREVYDPEIPVNIVDLGLVYDVQVAGNGVDVKMTLTTPGCGMGPTICKNAEDRIKELPGISVARVEVVWDPPWNQSMITEAGKMKLGLV